ncbi:MAG: hypothetical protein U0414_38315 [Polyangiaceae bacterium]
MRFLVASLVLAVTGCGAATFPSSTQTPPMTVCGRTSIDRGDGCLSVERLEAWLGSGSYAIRDANFDAGTSMYELTLVLPNGASTRVSFKRAPDGLDSANDHPRRQLAAYELQKLFLDPVDYVIAPTVFACVPIETDGAALPGLVPHDGVDCAFGILSMKDPASTTGGFGEPGRGASDPAVRADAREIDLLSALLDSPGPAANPSFTLEPMGGNAIHVRGPASTNARSTSAVVG